jgi:hypothetical protein
MECSVRGLWTLQLSLKFEAFYCGSVFMVAEKAADVIDGAAHSETWMNM